MYEIDGQTLPTRFSTDKLRDMTFLNTNDQI